MLDHPNRHIAGARDHELDLVVFLQHPLGGLDEILGPLLHRDPPKEEDDLFIALDGRTTLGLGLVLGDAVVHDIDFVVGHPVLAVYDRLGQSRDSDHAVRAVEPSSLDVVHTLIDVLSGAVELRGVDMAHQRFAGDLLEQQPRWVGQPVVGVDHIEPLGQTQRRDQAGVALGIAEKVAAVPAAARAEPVDRVEQ